MQLDAIQNSHKYTLNYLIISIHSNTCIHNYIKYLRKKLSCAPTLVLLPITNNLLQPIYGLYLVLVQQHVGNAVFDWKLAPGLWTDQKSIQEMNFEEKMMYVAQEVFVQCLSLFSCCESNHRLVKWTFYLHIHSSLLQTLPIYSR